MVSSKFNSLSVRPPTPPKDLQEPELDGEINEALNFLDDPFGTKQTPDTTAVAGKTLLSTPEQSPSSVVGGSSTGSRKKRVNFELQTCVVPRRDDLVAQPWTPQRSSPLRPLPQTRVPHPLKSILKQCDPTSTPPPYDESAPSPKPQSFAEMLESIVKMLAQDVRTSRLDAYLSIKHTMEAYDNIPDIESLRNKMGLLSQFIKRDIQAPGINGSGLDTALVQQALKFLHALLRIPDLKPAMDDDFCSFLIERSIKVCADPEMPKAVVNPHLALLMQQQFRPKVMTPVRVEKILDLLGSIHDRVTGLSVQAYRVRIYRKFIQQRPEVMTKHAESWLKFVMKAMLVASPDIHQSALDTTLSTAKTIGTDRHVVDAVTSLMNRVKSDGDTFGRMYAQELDNSLGSDKAALVPQIWAAVSSLLQDSLFDNKFKATREWLELLEKFLNSPNGAVRLNANVAFCFFIYSVNMAEPMPHGWSNILIKTSQQQFTLQSKPGKETRKSEIDAAASSYFTMLYYAFRPNTSPEHLARYWKEYVADFWTSLMRSSKSVGHRLAACRVASALFTGSGRPWNQNRALEFKVSYMIQRSEIPKLAPGWVRKSMETILRFVGTLIDEVPWHENAKDNEAVRTMWTSLLESLVEASSQEVMATTETKEAVAQIVNMLRRLWDRHTAKQASLQEEEDRWADKFCFLIRTVIEKLGAFQFVDKCLTRNEKDEFEASTPSTRSRQQASRVSPLLYFMDLVIARSEGRLSDSVRLRVMQLILEPCLGIQSTRLSKLELLRDCSAAVGSTTTGTVATDFWARIGSLAKSCIEEQPSDSNERITRPLGKEYEAVVDILAHGSSVLAITLPGQGLLERLADTVRKEAGDGALILAVIEKVSDTILTRVSEADRVKYMPYATVLLESLPSNISRRALEQGRQSLYPSSPQPSRHLEFDPYSHFYSAIISIGMKAYDNLPPERIDETRKFLAGLKVSIEQCPGSLTAIYLRKTQPLLTLWVADAEGKLRGKEQPTKQVRREVLQLWKGVIAAIERIPKKDNTLLSSLEPLICAGLTTKRRKIVSLSVTMWNSSFGQMESLNYPPRLEKALQRLRSSVELSAPSLADPADNMDETLAFDDSDSSADVDPEQQPPHIGKSPFHITKPPQKSRSPMKNARRTPSRPTPKHRLRHDDSQIQFEPILSSPPRLHKQESQVLTERQKEIMERQRAESRLFSDVSAHSPSQPAEMSPKPQHKDQLDSPSGDDLPNTISRTPLKNLASMGPMDAFLGSSPTPNARNRSQQIMSDDTNVATPNAVRTVQITDDLDELASSPPEFKRAAFAESAVHQDTARSLRNHVVSNKDAAKDYSMSFDDGSTIDDELAALCEAPTSQDEFPTELELTEVPSSTIEVQLNAQLVADLDAHSGSQAVEESGQPSSQAAGRNGTQRSDTSRIGDSFESNPATQEQGEETPSTRQTRRSTRLSASAASSPAKPSGTKKKRGRPRKNLAPPVEESRIEETRIEETKVEGKVEPSQNENIASVDDCIVLATAPLKSSKRKKASQSQDPPSESQSIIPESQSKRSGRKRSRRQSTASQLSVTEAQTEEILVNDTPAPKRARKSLSQDVSEANVPPPPARRLSHVQVSPRPSLSTRAPSAGPDENENSMCVAGAPALVHLDQVSPVGEQKAKASAAPQLHGDTASTTLESRPSSQASAAGGNNNGVASRSLAERVILTPKSIMERLRRTISDLKDMVLGRDEERELDDVMFDLRREVHAAGRRGEEGENAGRK